MNASSAAPDFPVLRIDDPADARLGPYTGIRERDLRGHGDRFVAEGEVVLRVLLTSSRFAADSVLVSERRLEALRPLLSEVAAEVPVLVASQAVMDEVVGFHIHRGVLAVGRRLPEPAPTGLLAGLPERALVVGLVGVSNHDNIGGIFRNAAAFGVDAVLLDGASCDPLYRKAIRVSVGGTLKVPFARVESGEAMLACLDAAGFAALALSPAGEEELMSLGGGRGRTALLLGAEGPGLPPGLMARCRTVRIDMEAGFDSLNVATTSGIALYALGRR